MSFWGPGCTARHTQYTFAVTVVPDLLCSQFAGRLVEASAHGRRRPCSTVETYGVTAAAAHPSPSPVSGPEAPAIHSAAAEEQKILDDLHRLTAGRSSSKTGPSVAPEGSPHRALAPRSSDSGSGSQLVFCGLRQPKDGLY